MLTGVISGGITIADVEVLVGLLIAGFVGWRWKRGDFYKAIATEKTAEADKLRAENDRLHGQKDLTPILDRMETITEGMREITLALERHAKTTDAVFQKVADMNGSLRAHSTAMQALADRLILEEASRGLLAEAAKPKPAPGGTA